MVVRELLGLRSTLHLRSIMAFVFAIMRDSKPSQPFELARRWSLSPCIRIQLAIEGDELYGESAHFGNSFQHLQQVTVLSLFIEHSSSVSQSQC